MLLIKNNDGLYLDGVWVATADEIAATFQSNDLTKPTTLQSSYTNTFHIPDSVAVRKLTQHAEQLDSRSRWPYRTLAATVVAHGETIFRGYAEFDHFSAGWDITLFQDKKNLFDRLDRSLRTLQLDRLDHYWTLEQINLLAESSEGVCYPLIDYGLNRVDTVPNDTIFPAIFVTSLITQMLFEEGYTLVGSLLTDELYKRLIVPFSEQEPTAHDQQWQDDRKARVTWQADTEQVDRGTLGRGHWIDRIQPFNQDNLPEQGFEQGKFHCFNTTTHEYVCPQAMRVRVQGYQGFKALCVNGVVEVVLSVLKNGNSVANARFEAGTGYNLLYLITNNVTLDETIACQAGDRLQINLLAQRQTDLGAWRMTMYNDLDNSWVSFTPDLTLHTGDLWPVARNLPDVSCLSLLKALGFLMSGTWSVNPLRHEVHFVSFSSIVNNTSQAVDWSFRVNTGAEPAWTPRLDPYAQINYLRWKEIDETKNTQVAIRDLGGTQTVNFGDGVLLVDASTLEPDTNLFEVAFAASTDSTNEVPNYGLPPLIKTRSTSGYGDSLTINKQGTTPRLLLASFGAAQPMKTKRLKADGITLEEIVVHLKPCWFGARPIPAITSEPSFILAFSQLQVSRGEQCLIDRYYDGLSRVLRRMRVLDVSVTLYPRDIADLDFERPIRLQRVHIGSLVISDGFYYLNKIADYVDGAPCQVTLIAFT
ncbi:hypothetical protein [Spirosoma panaciterrae]|uniref:hypothetical protein n=1 Tax=Spirosoma panaciterrae TaxID=496058 RepID=UPI00036D3BA1|nr:hypothetical protein [Spirosoma panaciterrae]